MKTDRRKALKMAVQVACGGVSTLSLKTLAQDAAIPGMAAGHDASPAVQKAEARGWPRLIAHWQMDGDCQDAVGAHQAEGHGIKFVDGHDGRPQGAAQFIGVDSFIKVDDHEDLHLETREFSVAFWVNLPENLESAHGDLVTKYDSQRRKGFNLSVTGSSPSYGSVGDAKNLHFGIDNGINGSWLDCGKPWRTNPLISTLTVYKGDLYTGIADASKPEDTCHVFRYAGGTDWVDCGRVGTHPLAVSVFSMIVHKDQLYAGAGVWDWYRAHAGVGGPDHVYRYAGGTRWEDCGQFGNGYRVMALASFKGDLYAGDDEVKFYRYEGDRKWAFCGQLGPSSEILFQSATVYQGHLYGSTHPAMYRYEGGSKWVCIGRNPQGMTQVHKLQVYEGRLYAGTWPHGKVLRYEGDDRWTACGQLGIATDQCQINEVNDLTVYNGKLYAGVIPKAEVYRYDRDSKWALAQDYQYDRDSGWTRLRSLVHWYNWSASDGHNWFRVPCLTQFQGRLYLGTSTCYGRYDPEVPPEAGRVHGMEAGKNVSYDDDLGAGWKHIVAVREKGHLKLYINGELKSSSGAFDNSDYDISSRVPLLIGFGARNYLNGSVDDLRFYGGALTANHVSDLYRKGGN